MARLVISRGDSEERHVELTTGTFRIGRSAGNDLVLDNDGKSVSRFHAELRHEGGAFVLVDLNSQNGVWIDGRRVQRDTLAPGAVAVIGPYRLSILTDAEAAALPPLPAATAPVPDTVVLQAAPSSAKADSATKMVRPAVRPPPAPARPPGPGAIDRVMQLPRPVLVGGLAAVVLVIIIVAQLTRGGSRSARTASQPGAPKSSGTVAADNQKAGADQSAGAKTPDARDLAQTSSAAQSTKPDAVPAVQQKPGTTEPRLTSRQRAAKAEADLAAARTARLENALATARAALERGDAADAQRIAGEILREDPQFPEAAAVLERAREAEARAQQQAKSQAAALAIAEARRLESAGELRAAFDEYQRAAGLDAGANVGPAVTALRQRMRTAGEDAYSQARLYESRGRTADALTLYQRAVQLLPDDHPNRSIAQAKVTALKAGGK